MIRLDSIRQKLMAVVMLSTLAALLVSIGGIIAYDLRSYHHTLVGDMRTQAELLGHMTSAALAFDDTRLATENLELLRLRPSVKAGAIYNAGGNLFATYDRPGQLRNFPAHPPGDTVQVAGGDLILYKRIIDKGEFLGTVYLRAEYALVARLLDYLAIAGAVTLLALLVAFLMMLRLDRIITAPILAITAIAREVVAGRDYSRRAPRISNDEAAELVDSFNAMLAEIEQRTSALESSSRAVQREADQRSRAQQEVMRLNEQLEQRVHERTLQLERSNAELALAMDAAKSANMAKSAFLSAMSHELRTPLNAILGFGQILASDVLPSTAQQKKDFAGHIMKSGRHLLTLINEILDLAKIESGTITLSMEPVALGEILAECDAMVAPLAAQHRVRILFPDHCETVVQADRTRLKQVLLNLLSNAIKYNRDMGAVVVGCSEQGQRVRLSVQDTGLGLSEQQLAGLFQPFNRLGQEGGPEEGTGIGLVVTRRLIEMMDGAIGVSSSIGVGTMFWIEMARAQPLASPLEHCAAACAAPAAAPSDLRTLLYVEDNPANLKLVEELIRFRADLHLLSAPDGHLGVELARAHLPDLILMDLNLPGMSGTDAMKVLRADARTAHIPIIALTANAMPHDIERGLADGFYRYLTKPINLDEFTAAIDSAVAHVAARAHGGAA